MQRAMCKIKDYRNGKDITEAEDIRKWWQEYIQELCKKSLNDSDNCDGVVTVTVWSGTQITVMVWSL